MNNYKSVLQSLGLGRYEAQVYITLLENGPLSPSNIEKAGRLLRPVVYKSLANLISRGLVSARPKGKRKLYIAESPDKLTEIFTDIENNFLSTIENLHKIHAEQEAARAGKSERPVITYSEGDKAVRNAYMDIIDSLGKGDTYYRYSPSYESFDRKRFLPKKYRDARDKKQLERYVIVNEFGTGPNPALGRDVKMVPKAFDIFNHKIGFIMYANKVAIIDYESGGVITIAHKKFVEFQKNIFRLLYSKL